MITILVCHSTGCNRHIYIFIELEITVNNTTGAVYRTKYYSQGGILNGARALHKLSH